MSLEQGIQLELQVELQSNFLMSSATAGAFTAASQTFVLSTFSGAANLLAVFDQYRIDQIECWLECPSVNQQVIFPEVYSCVDLDDANVAVNAGQIQDHLGSLVACGPAGHYHKWRPHIAVATFSGAFTSYGNEPAGWVDSASPSVQHFGLKTGMISNGASVVSYSLVARAVVSFRAPSIA
jgi:hypothetical protein